MRGELPEAPGDTGEFVGYRVRPAQIVDRLGFNGMQVDEPHEKRAVRVLKRREMRLVQPRRVFADFPYDSAYALVALADFTARGPWFGRRYFGPGAHDLTGAYPFAIVNGRSIRISRLGFQR